MEKKRLGRGLDTLMGGELADTQAEVALDKIQHNPFQPRKNFDKDDLASLCASVKSHGILQPLVVRPAGVHYQSSLGERGYAPAQERGLNL